MNAAIYCRKSTAETNGNGATEDTKSVRRQEEHARAYCARKGWAVADEHVFVDDGISGAEFEGRPGFVRLMNALKPKPAFSVLVMSEESRLGREMIATAYALKQIVTAGVRCFYYLEDRERTLYTPTDKVLLAVNAYAGELEREMARQRSRDAARQRATHGYVTGGTCFGYRNRRTDNGHVAREIAAEEAEVVRKIFRMCRDGKGAARICRALNAANAPTPRAQQGRPRGWVPSSVRAVLYREVYRGQVVWGKARKRDQWGQLKFGKRPEAEWVRTAVPELRIVDDELWDAAHERMATSRANYLRATDGRLWGKPANGVESKYLLTGMATCGECGGGMLVYSRSHGKKRAFLYGCPRARVGLCRNDLEAPMPLADATALAMMNEDVLAPEVIELTLKKLMAKLAAPAEDAGAARKRLGAGLRETEAELARLASAIASGDAPETLLYGIREREARRKHLLSELNALDAGPAALAAAPTIRAEVLRLLEDWRALLTKHVGVSRQGLRKLLDRERFVFRVKGTGAGRYYELTVKPTLERFFAAVPTLKKAGTSPTGFEPVFWP